MAQLEPRIGDDVHFGWTVWKAREAQANHLDQHQECGEPVKAYVTCDYGEENISLDEKARYASYLSKMKVGETRKFTTDDGVVELELHSIARGEEYKVYYDETYEPNKLEMQVWPAISYGQVISWGCGLGLDIFCLIGECVGF